MMALSRFPEPAVPAAGATVCAVATTLAQRAKKTAMRWFSTGENSLAHGGLTGVTGWVLIGWWCDLENESGYDSNESFSVKGISLALAQAAAATAISVAVRGAWRCRTNAD